MILTTKPESSAAEMNRLGG
ncbi:hypothetical protein VCCP1047_3104, partial [Vibrio cholerae CP1047(20)]